MDTILSQIDPHRMPAHVAVIMDGNGRWAKSRGLNRSEGHVKGCLQSVPLRKLPRRQA